MRTDAQARVHHNQSEFIALQALELDDKTFYLWTRAGRVGCAGKSALSGPYAQETTVVNEFCTLFANNTLCEWDERHHHGRRYQEGRYRAMLTMLYSALLASPLMPDASACCSSSSVASYTWIELDYSTGTPYSESLTSALADNQGQLDRIESNLDEYGLLVPPAPLPVSLMSPGATLPLLSTITGRKRRRTASTSTRRSLAAQFELFEQSDSKTTGRTRVATAATEVELKHPPPSTLPEAVQTFVTLIADHADAAYAYSAVLPDDSLDDGVLQMPLGRLSKSTVLRVERSALRCPDLCSLAMLTMKCGRGTRRSRSCTTR